MRKIQKWMKMRSTLGICLLIFLMIAGSLFVLQTRGTIAGSRTDWISQHTAIADYFRKRFYETHNLFPQYAGELGGGQNIYNFAYYGLFNPLYLLSWLFPFLSIETWFQLTGVLTHLMDGMLCFVWLRRHASQRASLAGALMLMLSSAVVYHTYTQVMFVNYFPYLLLMLNGADIRRKKGKGMIMAMGTVGLLLTSFYFAPAGIAAVAAYLMCSTQKQGLSVWEYGKKLIWQAVPVFFGGVLSLFYLVPVLYALIGGRQDNSRMSLRELFLPDISGGKYLYSPYGLGLTAMAVIILCIWICAGKSKERMMAILLCVIFVIPVFPWILNGRLYVQSKVFLPFLPLVVFLCARFFDCVAGDSLGDKSQPLTGRSLAAGYGMGVVFLFLGSRGFFRSQEGLLLMADLFVCGIGLLVSVRRKICLTALLTVCVMYLMCTAIVLNTRSMRVSRQAAGHLQDWNTREAAASVLEEEPNTIRMEMRGDSDYEKANQNRVWVSGQNLTTCYSSCENPVYHAFRKSVGLAQSTRNCLMQDAQNNPLFLRFMGVKYLIGGEGMEGWKKMRGEGQAAVYENERVAPMFYLTNQTVAADFFDQISWQEKQLMLLEAAAVPEQTGRQESREQILLTETEVAIEKSQDNRKFVKWKDNTVQVKTKKAVQSVLSMENPTEAGEYVFLSFRVKNHRPERDVNVTVNGVKNKLSSKNTDYYNGNEVFHYVFSLPEGTDKLKVQFGSGVYDICEIDCRRGSVDEARNTTLYQTPVNFIKSSDGDGYRGKIQTKEEQWFITSIPYDSHFRILVDKKTVETKQVNGGFVGVKIPGGTHEIEIRYHSPGRTAGMCLSGLAIFAGGMWRIGGTKWRRKSICIRVGFL